MNQSLGGFRATLLIGWMTLSAAGLLYARAKGIPTWAALPALAAFLVEYPFYLLPGFRSLRERVAGHMLPGFLLASALLPYLVYSLGVGQFHWGGFLRLCALALALSLWYAVLPGIAVIDVAYLGVVAAVLLGKYFDGIYVTAYPGLQIQILGHLTLIQIAAMTLLLQRRVVDAGYGFLPDARELRIGLVNFAWFLPIGFPIAFALKVMHFRSPAPWWVIAGTFFGILWVVALSEEFFFRGLLQPWLTGWTGSSIAGLVVTSVLFGSVHLWFRGFPNWRFSLVAAVAGFFYGRARNQAGSIRAGMVTHALVVTTWRAVLQ